MPSQDAQRLAFYLARHESFCFTYGPQGYDESVIAELREMGHKVVVRSDRVAELCLGRDDDRAPRGQRVLPGQPCRAVPAVRREGGDSENTPALSNSARKSLAR